MSSTIGTCSPSMVTGISIGDVDELGQDIFHIGISSTVWSSGVETSATGTRCCWNCLRPRPRPLRPRPLPLTEYLGSTSGAGRGQSRIKCGPLHRKQRISLVGFPLVLAGRNSVHCHVYGQLDSIFRFCHYLMVELLVLKLILLDSLLGPLVMVWLAPWVRDLL